jgi:hypothetical protein
MFKQRCYFSDLEHNSRTGNPLSGSKSPHQANAHAFFYKDTLNSRSPQLFIRHDEGYEFQLKVFGNLSDVFALPDGIMVEIPYCEDINENWLHQVVTGNYTPVQKTPRYSYFSLLAHPLNDFRLVRSCADRSLFNQAVC